MTCTLVIGLTGCASKGKQQSDDTLQTQTLPAKSEKESQDHSDIDVENGIKTQVSTTKSNENGQEGQIDTELEEELKKYRQERFMQAGLIQGSCGRG